jgi:hypothetical protein
MIVDVDVYSSNHAGLGGTHIPLNGRKRIGPRSPVNLVQTAPAVSICCNRDNLTAGDTDLLRNHSSSPAVLAIFPKFQKPHKAHSPSGISDDNK